MTTPPVPLPAGPPVIVLGVGADGADLQLEPARSALTDAEVVLGGARHLAMLPADHPAQRRPWPSPLRPALPGLLAELADRRVVVLASGDPLVRGIGSTLIELLGADRVVVHPAVSSPALARARMGWPAETVTVISSVGRDPAAVLRPLAPDARLLVLSADETTPAAVAGLLVAAGYGPSRLTVLGDLGAASETRHEFTAESVPAGLPRLNVLAVQAVPSVDAPWWSTVPGLPDAAFDNDGQLTKREVRATALAHLAPAPGELLWDVGAGAGSIAIEWARCHPRNRAIAVERSPERADRIEGNARRLGVPEIQVVRGDAASALAGLAAPDAVFIGGGAGVDGVIDTCWGALRPGGRLVVHAVTVETEMLLHRHRALLGGELVRIAVEHLHSLGSFTGWKPLRTIVQWSVTKQRKDIP